MIIFYGFFKLIKINYFQKTLEPNCDHLPPLPPLSSIAGSNSKKIKKPEYAQKFLFGASITFIIGGALLNAYSIHHWLKYGEWPFTYFLILTTLLSEKFAIWYLEPHSWIGINKILQWIFEKDFSFYLYLIGFALHGIQILIEEMDKD